MVEGGDKLFNQSEHMADVFIPYGGLKILYGCRKLEIVEGHRLHYHNLFVGRVVDILVGKAYFFKQLFAGTKAGIKDVYKRQPSSVKTATAAFIMPAAP